MGAFEAPSGVLLRASQVMLAGILLGRQLLPFFFTDQFIPLLTIDHSRYGRKLSSGGKKKVLERLYVPEEEEDADIEVEDDDVVEQELKKLDEAGLGKLDSLEASNCKFSANFT